MRGCAALRDARLRRRAVAAHRRTRIGCANVPLGVEVSEWDQRGRVSAVRSAPDQGFRARGILADAFAACGKHTKTRRRIRVVGLIRAPGPQCVRIQPRAFCSFTAGGSNTSISHVTGSG